MSGIVNTAYRHTVFTCVVQSRSHALSTTKSFLFAQKENKYFTTYR